MKMKQTLVSLAVAMAFSTAGASAHTESEAVEHSAIKHVLLISVDGFHAVDLSNYVAANPHSTLAALQQHGVTYAKASTAKPSDSFPGLTALVTGATPKAAGLYYDDSYDRKLSPSNQQVAGDNCATIGTEVQYFENLDSSFDTVLGGSTLLNNVIDPNNLPRDSAKGCAPVYPHQFIRVNSIFNVAHDAGLYTAWSDKHPAYEWVRGNANTGAEDLYTPEINSPPRDLYCVLSEGPGGNPDGCAVLDANKQWTDSIPYVNTYDGLKVAAVVNEIHGYDHTGKTKAPVPAIFGMNFQSVSVGQKLAAWGYTDAAGTPSTGLKTSLDFVDASLGKFVAALSSENLLDSTLIIVAAKHGQSPIDRTKLHMLKGSKNPVAIADVTDVTDVLASAGITAAQATEDDVSLLWLDPKDTGAALAALQADLAGANTAHIQKIYHGAELIKKWGNPATDTRTPDLIVQPIPGTIYSGSKKKIAEHGGLSTDDTHSALLLSNPGIKARTVDVPVTNMQVAPTILRALGLRVGKLDSVRLEGVHVLPESELR